MKEKSQVESSQEIIVKLLKQIETEWAKDEETYQKDIEVFKSFSETKSDDTVATLQAVTKLGEFLYGELLHRLRRELTIVKLIIEVNQRIGGLEDKQVLDRLNRFEDFLAKGEKFHKNLEAGGGRMYGDTE
jgi:hypothetical protein